MLDRPGHYLQQPNSSDAHLREAFIEVDLTRNDELPQRIAEAVRGYGKKIDAIATICDPLLPYVARANQILGLPTNPPEAFEIAIDKHKTRMLDQNTDQAFRVSSVDDLNDCLRSSDTDALEYPLIVKPTNGNGSEGVVKVDSEQQLKAEVERSFITAPLGLQERCDLVIESYIDGPEVDANLILWDGEVLFCEITDDFPSTADMVDPSEGKSSTLNFLETQNVLPSRLPIAEQEMLKNEIQTLLVRAGFRYGFLHCEARVKNSAMSYKFSPASGLLDLHGNGCPDQSAKARAFLIEINARTPGYIAAAATHLTYGIDPFATVLLSACRDESRMRALARPFDFSHRRIGAQLPEHELLSRYDFQYNASILFIHPSRPNGGTLPIDLMDAKDMLIKNLSDSVSADQIAEWQPHFKKGDRVPGPASGELYWLVDLIVTSTKGREALLEQCLQIKAELSWIPLLHLPIVVAD
jgi:biotin carboxylase